MSLISHVFQNDNRNRLPMPGVYKAEEDRVRLVVFLKGKKMPIGTVSHGRKKVAEGKWRPIKAEKKTFFFKEEDSFMVSMQKPDGGVVRRRLQVGTYYGGKRGFAASFGSLFGELSQKKGEWSFLPWRGKAHLVVDAPKEASVTFKRVRIDWPEQGKLEWKDVLYHHTSVDAALDILKRNTLRAGFTTRYKHISFTPQLNYHAKRMSTTAEVSLQFSRKKFEEDFDLSKPKGEVHRAEEVIVEKRISPKKYLSKVVLRENRANSLSKDVREPFFELLEYLKKRSIPYTYTPYKKPAVRK